LRTRLLVIASALLMTAALALVFLFVPTDAGQGIIQRIFYFHVPVAWVAFLAFFVTFVAGIIYLVKRNLFWDSLASRSAEIGLIFTTLVLVTGSIWARSEWNTWWTWEARLTTSLVLWFIYLSYFVIRAFISDPAMRARFAAVVGIVGFIDVPIVMFSVNNRGLHPGGENNSIFHEGLGGLMLVTLIVSVFAFTALYLMFLDISTRIEEDRREIKMIRDSKE